MSELFYRFISRSKGIYEAVGICCAPDDPRRLYKPDGSWLPKAGPKFHGAVSYWTLQGLQKYQSSGLMDWHVSVIQEPVQVLIAELTVEPLYKDEFQVISHGEQFNVVRALTIDQFLDPIAGFMRQ